MQIGKTVEIWTNIPKPVRITRREPAPAKEPAKKEPEKVPEKSYPGGYLEIVPLDGNLDCPKCDKPLSWVEGEGGLVLACRKHGDVLELGRS